MWFSVRGIEPVTLSAEVEYPATVRNVSSIDFYFKYLLVPPMIKVPKYLHYRKPKSLSREADLPQIVPSKFIRTSARYWASTHDVHKESREFEIRV